MGGYTFPGGEPLVEETPPCEQCEQLERLFALYEHLEAEQDARIRALQQSLRDKDARIAALQQRYRALRRRGG